MWFELTGTIDLSKDDIENLKAHGFDMKFEKIDEVKTEPYNTSYRISMYYALFIKILTINDLLTISRIFNQELIISNSNDSKQFCSLEVYNGCRE